MSSYDILIKYADQCGWWLETQINLLLEYIDNQQQPDAFEDFFAQKAADERQPTLEELEMVGRE